MQCELTGRPCCAGLRGECIITTRQHCDFLRGHYNPEAALCSQVKCLNRVCGMAPFLDDEYPDQFYRVFTSLFLHAGILHLLITLLIQFIFMRDLEKMIGWHRISIIYLLSGCLANLVSGIFLPYQVETGPTGSLFALLGVVLVEFLQNWRLMVHPWLGLIKLIGPMIGLLGLGLMPWIDNYAHATGLVSGVLLAYVFLPFLGHSPLSPSIHTVGPAGLAGGHQNRASSHRPDSLRCPVACVPSPDLP
ncbi:unnamed protein product, partial [Protopolystoma xenopodis]